MVASASLMNNFNGGLKTEFTGLNFPENACTDTENVVFSLIGEALRREGIDLEDNAQQNGIFQTGKALNTYRWSNVGGDGETQVLVSQIGNTLYFFNTSAATEAAPMSAQLLASTVDISTFTALNNSSDTSLTECQFTDGNGYLFVFHPACDPFYCTYDAGTITASIINLQIRDFAGIFEPGIAVNLRPTVLTNEHSYNLNNQGWISGGSIWQANIVSGGSFTTKLGSQSLTVQSGLSGITNSQIAAISVAGGTENPIAQGNVVSYTSSTLTLNINYLNPVVISNPSIPNPVFDVISGPNIIVPGINITPVNSGLISTWSSAGLSYPSNADIWYEYKDSSGVFSPATTAANISQGSGQSPQGHYVFNPFNQDRTLASGTPGLTPVMTSVRPKCGTWFQGRVWYSGVDASQQATGDAQYYTWTENIYFSQIVDTVADFGSCYQVNDPSDETLNEELPTDGGVIVIQGCGSIYNLFPIQNGVLVFAQNGIWIIRGNQGLGFTANDYSINKISGTQNISSTSLVNVQGYPMFWNEEGIYFVKPGKEEAPYGFGGFTVEPLTVGTILSYYNQIPRDSKKFVRGDYNPISYVIQWCFRSAQESGIVDRYQFDTILNLNVYNHAFYPYTIDTDTTYTVSDVVYMSYPSGTLDPTFKYFATDNTNMSFAEERDDVNWLDWFSVDGVGVDYSSYFVTGYNLHGKGLKKWSSNYIQVFCNNSAPYAYTIQGIWDYAGSGNSGRWSTIQTVTNFNPNYNRTYRRHKLRGHGISLQIKVSSVSGQPFVIDGWSMFEDVRQGP